MANGLERKVGLNGISLTENVAGLIQYQYAGVARNLADKNDVAGARAALDLYAEGTGDYQNLHIAIEAMAISPDAIKNAAKMYAKERDKILERTKGQEFMSYFEQCESFNAVELQPGDRKIFGLRMAPISAKTIGDISKEIERANKILKETLKNPSAYPDSTVTEALRIQNTYGRLLQTVHMLLNYNDDYLAMQSKKLALGDTAKQLKNVMLGFNFEEE